MGYLSVSSSPIRSKKEPKFVQKVLPRVRLKREWCHHGWQHCQRGPVLPDGRAVQRGHKAHLPDGRGSVRGNAATCFRPEDGV